MARDTADDLQLLLEEINFFRQFVNGLLSSDPGPRLQAVSVPVSFPFSVSVIRLHKMQPCA